MHYLNFRREDKVYTYPTIETAKECTHPCAHKINLRIDGEKYYVPLMQDALQSPFLMRLDGGFYGADPIQDLSEYYSDCKLLHVVNMKGSIKDLASRSWTATGVNATNINDEPALQFGNSGYLTTGNGQAIETGDFTFLSDFCLSGPNGCDAPADHYLISGVGNALQVKVNKGAQELNVSYATSSGGTELVTVKGDIGYGKECRVVIQRKDGICNIWINGKHAGVNISMKYNFAGSSSDIGREHYSSRGYLNGYLRNLVLWNKAVYGSGNIECDPTTFEKTVQSELDITTVSGTASGDVKILPDGTVTIA